MSLKLALQSRSGAAVTSGVASSSTLRTHPLRHFPMPKNTTKRSTPGVRSLQIAKTTEPKTARSKASHSLSTAEPEDQKQKLKYLSVSLTEVQDKFKIILKSLNDSNAGLKYISFPSVLYMRSDVTRLSTKLRHIRMDCDSTAASKGNGTEEELLQLAEIEETLRRCDFQAKLCETGVKSLETSKRPTKRQKTEHY
ncbi:hypothetical protein AOQ84DRAFT_392664 [Glonium stellatum]|uniref:Uncharacterized protein n=1 Tax=Glonium stellatum TaxID=574774 RepID=A0A8E2EQN9_9PEZI|nr:hypothetical protein AOQ84DRAFT_392664 [Glonium stellatum]